MGIGIAAIFGIFISGHFYHASRAVQSRLCGSLVQVPAAYQHSACAAAVFLCHLRRRTEHFKPDLGKLCARKFTIYKYIRSLHVALSNRAAPQHRGKCFGCLFRGAAFNELCS